MSMLDAQVPDRFGFASRRSIDTLSDSFEVQIGRRRSASSLLRNRCCERSSGTNKEDDHNESSNETVALIHGQLLTSHRLDLHNGPERISSLSEKNVAFREPSS